VEHEDETERMEHESERVGRDIEETREEWEAKQRDSRVPGAQPEPRKESDQLPEEGQPEAVPDDTGKNARDEAKDSPGVPGEEETGTGNPDAAGAEDPDT
jgi:hypothetical protein